MNTPSHFPAGTETSPCARLLPHEQSALVPKLSSAEYKALRSSIAERGILVPLDITTDGVVLDGRARLRAADELGLARVPVRIVCPADPVEYMVRVAIERRHFSASQKAALAVRYAGYEAMRARARERSRANLRQNTEVATLPPRGKVREQLAELSGASERTVQDAISVYERDRELFERVLAGEIDVAPAARR